MAGITDWGLPKRTAAVVAVLAAGLGTGWGVRSWVMAELAAQEATCIRRADAERARSDAQFASKNDLLRAELAQERSLRAILREIKR